jgi:hypothetical protein
LELIAESFSRGWKEAVLQVTQELVAATVALLLVAFFVAFFYLYCLPSLGAH